MVQVMITNHFSFNNCFGIYLDGDLKLFHWSIDDLCKQEEALKMDYKKIILHYYILLI